jgi:septum formation protein
MLSTLSGNTHQVITGVALQLRDKNLDETFHAVTNVTFNTLSDRDIYYYIDTYKPFDKAGSYGIQDWFAVFVKHIDGCFYNVMGLPLANLWEHINNVEIN